MANFDDAIGRTLANEGGAKYTNDPNDRGGETKYGISKRSFPNEDIKNLTEERAKELYKQHYWDRLRCDDIDSQFIAEDIFDNAVNMGVKTTGRMVQRILDIKPIDGFIGNQSLKVVNQADEISFNHDFALFKIARYSEICDKNKSQKKYLHGWIRRVLRGVR